ncbi:hypothetical protein WN944_015839 [Citrus x changshan-huyou]|uniref:Uncharacterized protein n=1 Tax=Citrus x changshan-huyou TaxID=2935761 RepID=A0AAP0M893_9ROSI
MASQVRVDQAMAAKLMVLTSLGRSAVAENAAYNAWNEVVGSFLKDNLSERIQSYNNEQAVKVLHQLYGDSFCISEIQ